MAKKLVVICFERGVGGKNICLVEKIGRVADRSRTRPTRDFLDSGVHGPLTCRLPRREHEEIREVGPPAATCLNPEQTRMGGRTIEYPGTCAGLEFYIRRWFRYFISCIFYK